MPSKTLPTWLQLLALLLIAWLLKTQLFNHRESSTPRSNWTPDQIHTLAATVKAEVVVMYTTTECGYCHQAKAWLNQHGFAYTECNMSVDSRCESEFASYRANGTPFLVLNRQGREHRMHDGFDSDEFLAALSL